MKLVRKADGALPGELRAAGADIDVVGHPPAAVALYLTLHSYDCIDDAVSDLDVTGARGLWEGPDRTCEVPLQSLLQIEVPRTCDHIQGTVPLTEHAIFTHRIHDPALHINTDIRGRAGGNPGAADGEIMDVGIAPTDIQIQHVGEEPPAPSVSVEGSHEGHLEVINEVRLIKSEAPANRSHRKIGRAGDRRQVPVDASRELPGFGLCGLGVCLRSCRSQCDKADRKYRWARPRSGPSVFHAQPPQMPIRSLESGHALATDPSDSSDPGKAVEVVLCTLGQPSDLPHDRWASA